MAMTVTSGVMIVMNGTRIVLKIVSPKRTFMTETIGTKTAGIGTIKTKTRIIETKTIVTTTITTAAMRLTKIDNAQGRVARARHHQQHSCMCLASL